MGMPRFTHSRGLTLVRIFVLSLCAGFVGACSTKNETKPRSMTGPPDGGSPASMDDAAAPAAFVPALPATYGSKVKNLLTGLPLTEAELAQLTANPKAISTLIDAWTAT